MVDLVEVNRLVDSITARLMEGYKKTDYVDIDIELMGEVSQLKECIKGESINENR